MNVHFVVHCKMHLTYSTSFRNPAEPPYLCFVFNLYRTVFFLFPRQYGDDASYLPQKNICQGVAKKLGCFFFASAAARVMGGIEKEEAIKMAPFFHRPGSAFLPLHYIGAFSSSSSQGRFFRFHLHPSSFSRPPHFSPKSTTKEEGKGKRHLFPPEGLFFFSGRPRLTPTLPRKRRREGQLLSNQNSVDRTRKGTNQKQKGGGGATPVCHAHPSSPCL